MQVQFKVTSKSFWIIGLFHHERGWNIENYCRTEYIDLWIMYVSKSIINVLIIRLCVLNMTEGNNVCVHDWSLFRVFLKENNN